MIEMTGENKCSKLTFVDCEVVCCVGECGIQEVHDSSRVLRPRFGMRDIIIEYFVIRPVVCEGDWLPRKGCLTIRFSG